MAADFLPVKLSRLETGRVLFRDLFLNLPINGKFIKVAAAGDELREDLLARLASRGFEGRHVVAAEPNENGTTCQLYAEPSASQSNFTTTPPPPMIADAEPKQTEQSAIAPAAAAKNTESTKSEGAESLTKDKEPTSVEDTGEETTIEAATTAPEPKAAFSASEDVSEERRVSPGPMEETLSRIAASKPQELESTLVRGGESAAAEERTVVSGLEESLEEIVQIAAAEAEEIGTVSIRKLRDDLGVCLTNLKSARPGQVSEAIISASAAIEESVRVFEQSSSGSQPETLLASEMRAAADLAREKFEVASKKLAKARSFTGSAEEEFEQRFSKEEVEEAPERRRDRAEAIVADKTEIHRGKDDYTSQPPEERQAAAKKASEPSSVFPASESTPEHSPAYSTNQRAAVYKELPSIAARLAALLAHSLGYANQRFLSDLALTALLHFSKREEGIMEKATVPQLARVLLGNTPPTQDSIIEDSREILMVLEAYFMNPGCDRSHRDFSRRVFLDTLAEVRNRPESIGTWNEVRWTQVVEKGPSIDAQSLCGRASAAAIKISKDLVA
jgi:hypothetical protein